MSDGPPSDDLSAADAWDRIWSLFHDVLEQPADARQVFLDEACGDDHDLKDRVQKLLGAHEATEDNFLSGGLPSVLMDDDRTGFDPDPQPGEQLGPYELEQVIGEGGMGVVYRALQHRPVQRQVALKLLQLGMATRDVMARFEAERQALAMMSHSNIAKVYDAGATETGRPYFVMEYVAGVPITHYCDQQQLGIIDRLRIFLSVCDGVQHAHQKGVIHRDIKPSNVLVTTENDVPVPKIIDFGIAKALEQSLSEETLYTRMGVLIGTPGYMSPEQAGVTSSDIDTRADVYSLGVLLYKLLVGVLPFVSLEPERGLMEIQRAIRDEEPQAPSLRFSKLTNDELEQLSTERGTDSHSLSKQLRSDISWVALKAIEKDRERRYSSVSELSADIRRYLDGLPVQAHAPTAAYRATKFARRHKVGVTLTVLVAGLVVFFAGFMTVQTLRLQQALEETTLERNRAGQVSEFMVQLFGAANPNEAAGEALTVREMLDKGSAELKEELADQPELRAKLLATIGEAYRVLGGDDNASIATELFDQALKDLQSLPEAPDDDIAGVLNHLAEVYHDTGDYDTAERNYRVAITLLRQDPEAEGKLVNVLLNLSVLLTDRGALRDAEVLAREAVEIGQRLLGPRSVEVGRGMQRLGYILHSQGKNEEAAPMMADALYIAREAFGNEHPFTATALNYAAIVQRVLGNAEGAQAHLRDAVAIYRKTHGNNHPYLASTLSNLGLAYNHSQQYAEAEKVFAESLRISVANLGEDHPNVNSYRINLATTLDALSRYAEAVVLLEAGLESDRNTLDQASPYLLATLDRLASVLGSLGKPEAAEPLLRESLGLRREVRGENHSDTGVIYYRLAMNLLAQGQFGAAEEANQRAIEIHRRLEPANPVRLAASIQGLGRILQRRGDVEGARAFYEEAIKLHGVPSNENALPIAIVRYDLAKLAEETGDMAAAESGLSLVASVLRDKLPAGHADVANAEVSLGRVRCLITGGGQGLDLVLAARPVLAASFAADNWLLAMVDSVVGECRGRQGAFDEAEAFLQGSYETVRRARGDGHFTTQLVRTRLDELHEIRGQQPSGSN